jgi:hypothetical protein
MAVKTRGIGAARPAAQPRKPNKSRPRKNQPWLSPSVQSHLMHYLPVWLLVGLVILVFLPGIVAALMQAVGRLLGQAPWLPLVPILLIRLPHILAFARKKGGHVLRVMSGYAGELLALLRRLALRNLPLSLLAAALILLAIPGTRTAILNAAGRLIFSSPVLRPVVYHANIAPLFTPEIDFWSENINRWAQQYGLDPNLMATVMQIESCGHPTISSSAGAQGLFQVMPFHFLSSENQLDPDTNAMRGAGVLQACLDMANGDAGLAMACYNGGPRVLSIPYDQWHSEPQRYYTWGSGIYGDAVSNRSSSETLNRWLEAGGSRLCDMAGDALGIQ